MGKDANNRGSRGGCGCFGVAVFLVLCVAAAVVFLPMLGFELPISVPFEDEPWHALFDQDEETGSEDASDNVDENPEATDASNDETAEPEEDFSYLEGYYYFDQMEESEKKQYALMYEALSTQETVDYPSQSEEEIGHIRECVMADHPELFAVDGVTWTYLEGEENSQLHGEFFYSLEETKQYRQQIDAAVAECEAGIPADADDYARARYVYEYLVNTITYDHDAYNNLGALPSDEQGQTVVDALLEHSCVCAGYSRAFQLIMQDMGYPCVCVSGEIYENGDAHSWNLVQLDGEWYYVDVSWGDPSYRGDDGQAWEMGGVGYGYLNVTTEDMLRSRAFDSWQTLPECTAVADNYFVREGLMLYEADTSQVAAWGNDAVAYGDGTFSFRCADQYTYDQVKQGFEWGSVQFASGSGYTYTYYDDVFVFTVQVW